MLGFGQVLNLNRNQINNTDSWSSIEDGGSPDSLKGRTKDAYNQMMLSYRDAQDDTYTPSALTGFYAYNPRTQTSKTYLASVVKNTYVNGAERPANGPLSRMHPTLDEAVGRGNAHRTGFACAEMHALNIMLWDTNPAGERGVKVEGFMVTHGTPDKEDKGAKGGKMTMVPCLSTAAGMGCGEVLGKVGVEFDGGN